MTPGTKTAPPANISVLLPVYLTKATPQRVSLLNRAIGSVAEQHYPGRMELLVIDDGSPEPVAPLIEADILSAPHSLRPIRLPENQGIAPALNTGLREARYEIVARIDSDDAWSAGKIAAQLANLEADKDAALSATRGLYLFPDGTPPSLSDIPAPDWVSMLACIEGGRCPFPHGSVIGRKDIFLLLGGYPEGKAYEHAEDLALWSLWLRFFKAHLDTRPFYAITPGGWTVSHVHSSSQQDATALITQNAIKLGLSQSLPRTLEQLAETLGISLLQAGVLSFRIWRDRPLFACPPAALELLSQILPDRRLRPQRLIKRGTPKQVHELIEGFGDAPHVGSDASYIVAQAQ